MPQETAMETEPTVSRHSRLTFSNSFFDSLEYVTKPVSNTSEQPAISVSAAATSPPVQLSATAILRPAARLASSTLRAASTNWAGRRVSVICLEYSRKRQCGNGLCGDAFAASSKAQPFSGRRLHADLIRAVAEYLPDSRTHGIAIRPDPGRLADYGAIHMTNAATQRDNSVARKFQDCETGS